jgi:hypothetical protein
MLVQELVCGISVQVWGVAAGTFLAEAVRYGTSLPEPEEEVETSEKCS